MKLESEGLIRIEPRRGAYLRTFSIQDIYDLFDLREALEAHAVSIAQVNAETLEAPHASLERMRSRLDRGDKAGYIEEDVNFHGLLARAAGNQRLSELLERVQQQVWLFRRKTYDLTSSRAMTAHTAIVAALVTHDMRRAEALMREHICEVREKLLAHLEEERKQRSGAAPASA
jgi:DNA-binding GntR family transcriptional regulator